MPGGKRLATDIEGEGGEVNRTTGQGTGRPESRKEGGTVGAGANRPA